jgi:GDP-4-dehydro-6-deoxy-D-mannose reductase
MNALVTGITGFVGPHLAAHLAEAGDDVAGVSRRATAEIAPPARSNVVPRFAWDLSAADPDSALVERIDAFAPDVVYHLAAASIPADCGGLGDPTPAAWRTNVEGTRRVLALAAALRRPPRVVLFSSSHVYGAVDESNPPLSEDSPAAPRSAYGRTKLAAEVLGAVAHARRGLDVVVIRSFHMAGAGEDGRLMLPEWATQFARGGDGPVAVRSLDVRLDLLDVRDAVRAFRLVALHGASGGTYNVGSGRGITSGTVFEALARVAGVDRPVRQLGPGRRFEPIADVSRLVKLGPWSPEVPLEQTAADVLADWRRRLGIESKGD